MVLTPIQNWPGVKRALEAKIALYEELGDDIGKAETLAQLKELPIYA